MGFSDDYLDDEDYLDDDYQENDLDDLKRCDECGKFCPRDDLCSVSIAMGRRVLVCPSCARQIGSSMYQYFDE